MSARGLIVGAGSIFDITNNRKFPVQAGFELNVDHTNIDVASGDSLGTIPITTGRSFSGRFGFREITPDVMASLFGATIVGGDSVTVKRTIKERVTIISNAATLSAAVHEFGSNEVIFEVIPVGGEPLLVNEGASATDTGYVAYQDTSNIINFYAGDYVDGSEADVTFSTEYITAPNKTVTPGPDAIPQPLKLFAALQLHNPYLGVDAGGALGIYMASVTLDGTLGPLGAPVADVGEIGVNFRAKNAQSGDIRLHFFNIT